MAKKRPKQTATDIDWILRDRRVIDGLDHLGIQIVSVNLYQAMLPGLTNVTERARYYAFYAWCIHRYAQDGPPERSRQNWIQWLRPLDFAYAVACGAHDQAVQGDASAVVGADLATKLLKGKSPSATVSIRSSTSVNEKGRPDADAYFKNAQGGFGQYYRAPLRDLGLVREHAERVWPDVALTHDSGRVLAASLDRQQGFKALLEIARTGRATVMEFAEVGARVHPRSIRNGSDEQSVLRSVFLGTDPDVCRGQRVEQLEWRRQSLRLMLHYLHRAEVIDDAPDYEFRWACVADALPNGKRWTPPAEFTTVRNAWGTYQRNDVLNYALECLLWVTLDLLEHGPQSLHRLAQQIADMALARVPASDDRGSMPPLPRKMSDVVRACDRPRSEALAEPWGEASTWQWVERLRDASNAGDQVQMCGLAVRVLARLATDQGGAGDSPFSAIPGAAEMARSREVHLLRWWARVADYRDQRSRDFIARLVLEWVLLRHLRVATRKLAGQGVSDLQVQTRRGSVGPGGGAVPRAYVYSSSHQTGVPHPGRSRLYRPGG